MKAIKSRISLFWKRYFFVSHIPFIPIGTKTQKILLILCFLKNAEISIAEPQPLRTRVFWIEQQ